MSNNSEHCCLSCSVDISHKRKDAKYCSDRCRMRYRRDQKKEPLIKEIVELFAQLPNHSVHRTDQWLMLQSYDELEGKSQLWHQSDLKRMSVKALKDLSKNKKWLLAAEKVKEIWR